MLDALRNTLADNLYKRLGQHRWNSAVDQKKLVKSAQVIFDIGANVGQTSASYRKLFPAAHIWAFEPIPETFSRLTNRFKNDGQVHPINSALGDCQGTAIMNRGPKGLTDSMLLRANRTGEQVDVRIDTIDAFCASSSINNIDILKVDVEGMEAKVFAGASEMFRKNAIRFVFTEVFFLPSYEDMPLFCDLHAVLQKFGLKLYGLYSLSQDGRGRLEFGNALYSRD
jgi:FkbM family methyltransferase